MSRSARHSRTAVLMALAALVLAGCIGPTPYRPADGDTGYRDTRIEDNRFRVSFRANSATDRERVEAYLLYRAAEVTRHHGYDWFRIVERSRADETERVAPRLNYSLRFGYPYYRWGPPYGAWYPHRFHDPLWPRYRFGFGYHAYPRAPRVTGRSAHAEIRTFRGRKPADDPRAYDAREVLARIGPSLVVPAR